MGAKGYLSIRGVPVPRNRKLKSKSQYRTVLDKFFSIFTNCSRCQGLGYKLKEDLKTIEKGEIISIRYEGIEELEALKELENVNLGDKIKEILQIAFSGRKSCEQCNGSGFVKRKRKIKSRA